LSTAGWKSQSFALVETMTGKILHSDLQCIEQDAKPSSTKTNQ